VEEAARLASEGVVELNLIGQDTSYYGADRYGSPSLPKLLEHLAKVPGIRWIRILYAHPAHVSDDLIGAIRDLEPVVKYVDLPLQHISDRLLSLMRRETDGASIRRLVDRFRSEVPGMAIRTTFITGFPGETEDEVEELAGFLRQARFERVGIFLYSPEPKTPSEKMPGQLPEPVKQERRDRLMSIQREISEEMNQQWLGREIEVLVDEETRSPSPRPSPLKGGRVKGEGFLYLGRTYADAPEVDGQVFLKSTEPLQTGRMVRARVTDTMEYDLVAEPAG
jgi:ribosomal protein S12 methylthiotransferase